MRKLISLSLVLALSFQCLSKLGLITFYHFYQEYVTEEYCENKDQPLLECAGSCFLKKGLEKSNDSDDKKAETLKQIEIPSFILSSHTKEAVRTCTEIKYPNVKINYSFNVNFKPFHPPKVV